MFGFRPSQKEPEKRPPANLRSRTSLYGLAALYLAYLCWKIVWPYVTGDPLGPTTQQFLLGLVVLGGGTVLLAFLTWQAAHAPLPEPEPEEDLPPEDSDEKEDP